MAWLHIALGNIQRPSESRRVPIRIGRSDGGWRSVTTVGAGYGEGYGISYGNGYPSDILAAWLRKTLLDHSTKTFWQFKG